MSTLQPTTTATNHLRSPTALAPGNDNLANLFLVGDPKGTIASFLGSGKCVAAVIILAMLIFYFS